MKFVPDSRRLVLVLGMALLLAVPLGVSAAGAGHGSLDPGFGKGGIVTTAVGRPLSSAAAALAIQKDGKLVAAGGAGKGFALVRYNANGSLDRSFGSGGKVTTTIGPYGADASALVIQPDGKLVAAGDTIYSPAGGVDQDPSVHFALVRYQANGSLDRSFGSGGIVTTAIGALALGSHVAALVIRRDGKLVAAGLSLSSAGESPFTLVRYNANGSLDRRFGSGGIVTTTISHPEVFSGARGLVIQPDGKLVAVGDASTDDDFVLVRYNASGSLDRSFGTGGKVTTRIGSNGDTSAAALVIQPDGKLVVSGDTGASRPGHFALVRYKANGSLDPSFGSGGKAMTPIGSSDPSSGNTYASALARQPDGKLVVAGSAGVGESNPRFTLVRYRANGSLDRSFGSGGTVTTAIGPHAYAEDLAVQTGGKLVAAGWNDTGFVLARYLP